MEKKLTRSEILARRQARRPSFDVTCTIGTVYLDEAGTLTPYEAAMVMIANHNADGTFRFPAEQGGGTVVVTITHENLEEV